MQMSFIFHEGKLSKDRKISDFVIHVSSPPLFSRQVHYYHHNRSGYVVATSITRAYDRALMASNFCLAPLGGGHGQRQIIVGMVGCIPVTIGEIPPFLSYPFGPQTRCCSTLRAAQALHTTIHDLVGPFLFLSLYFPPGQGITCTSHLSRSWTGPLSPSPFPRATSHGCTRCWTRSSPSLSAWRPCGGRWLAPRSTSCTAASPEGRSGTTVRDGIDWLVSLYAQNQILNMHKKQYVSIPFMFPLMSNPRQV